MTDVEIIKNEIQELVDKAFEQGKGVGYDIGLEVGTHNGHKRGYDRLHKSIYGQTLDEMKADRGAWECSKIIVDGCEYKPKSSDKWKIGAYIDTLRNIIKVSDRSDCGIKEIDGTDEEAIQVAIKALEQELIKPTVESRPVIHANWLSGDCKGAHCSNCEEYTPFVYGAYNFCPNCGADMREGEE